MLTLLLALAVSQSTVLDDSGPPPPPPPEAAQVSPAQPLRPAQVELAPRSARLLTEEPRVSGGALAGRVGMSIGLGLVGELTGELAALGLTVLGYASGSLPVLVGAVILAVLVRIGFAALGVALGSALFGTNFGADLREVMPVVAISVGAAVIIGVVLSLIFPGGTLLFTALPLLGAAIATPLIVQARKADAGPAVLRDAVPMSGAVVSF